MPEWIQINSIDASPHDAGTAYVAATMYKSDDFRPYLYKTSDYGKTWKKIVNGIPRSHFTRVMREDPNHKGLLVAGTEFGLYISFDDGENWKPFQLNLPVTPITDVAFHKREQELVVATQGRVVLRARRRAAAVPVERQRGDRRRPTCSSRRTRIASAAAGAEAVADAGRRRVGENPPGGAVVYYWLKDRPQGDVTLEFLDSAGKLVRKFSSKAVEPPPGAARGRRRIRSAPPPARVPAQAGMNRFVWNLRYPDATTFPGSDHVGGQRHRSAAPRRECTRCG